MNDRTSAKKPAARKKTTPKTKRQGAATPKQGGRARSGGATRKPPAARAAVPAPIPTALVEHFGHERLELLRAECLPPDASEADFLRLLAEAERLGGDPLRGDVFLKRGMVRDGAPASFDVVAKCKTLLRYAERQADFAGHDEAAIFAEDDFTYGDPRADGGTLRERAGISHRTGLPGSNGDLVGAWCAAERVGRPPVVRLVQVEQHLGTPEERNMLEPDDPKRRFPDATLVAAAMSNALRVACGLNDVVGAEELAARAAAPAPTAVEDALDGLDGRILDLYREAQQLAPHAWPPAKVRARLLGADDRARGELADEMDRSLEPLRAAASLRTSGAPATTAEQHAEQSIAALRARRGELLAFDRFDRSDLDAEALAEWQAHLDHADGLLEAYGLDPQNPGEDLERLCARLAQARAHYDELRAAEQAEDDEQARENLGRQRAEAARDVARLERLVEQVEAR